MLKVTISPAAIAVGVLFAGKYNIVQCENAKPQSPIKLAHPKGLKVIVFGGCGEGKGSVTNAALNHHSVKAGPARAMVGGNIRGVTFQHDYYNFTYKGKNYILADTAGLNEADHGKVTDKQAVAKLSSLVLEQENGVSAVCMVMKQGRIKDHNVKNYKIFVEGIIDARKQNIPVLLCVTHMDGNDGKDPEAEEVHKQYLKELLAEFAIENCHFDGVIGGRFSHPSHLKGARLQQAIAEERYTADQLLAFFDQHCVSNKPIAQKGIHESWFALALRIVRRVAMMYFPNVDWDFVLETLQEIWKIMKK